MMIKIELGFEQYAVCDTIPNAFYYGAIAAADGCEVIIEEKTTNSETEYVVYTKEPAINVIRRAN